MTMKMKWIDSSDLAAELAQRHPEVDPRRLRFTDLYQWVLALPEFDGRSRALRRAHPGSLAASLD